MAKDFPRLAVIIPAAGVGKRMQANLPKQYLKLLGKTVVEHTISRFTDLPFVAHVIVVLAKEDPYFGELNVARNTKLICVNGGKERADSVLQGVIKAQELGVEWLMVHDAARPCVKVDDIVDLYQKCLEQQCSGILSVKVKDTMKRAQEGNNLIEQTVERSNLWHALTPQCSPTDILYQALNKQVNDGNVNAMVTDEASAIEMNNEPVMLVPGSIKNIKITEPEDLELAALYLQSEGL